MPFAFNQIAPTTIGTVDRWDVPLNRWLGVKFGAGYDDGLGTAVTNFTEDQIYDEGPIMKPDFATKTFGIEGHLKFTEPVSVGKASLLRRRKEAELEKMAYLDSASHGWFSAKAFAGFGASMAGGFAHPLDLGTAFIPFVGSSTKALELSRFGVGANRIALQEAFEAELLGEAEVAAAKVPATRLQVAAMRGLVPEEKFAAFPFPRLSASIIGGVMNQAAVEIPVAIEKFRSQADYGIEDAALNILGGGAFAGGLHLAGAALKKAWQQVADFHSRLTSESRDAMIREAESALMEGRKMDFDKIVSVDENAIRQRVMSEAFDEAKARAESESIVGKPLDFFSAHPIGSDVSFYWPEGGIGSGKVLRHTPSGALELKVNGKEFPVFIRESEAIVGKPPESVPTTDNPAPPEILKFESPDAKVGDLFFQNGKQFRVQVVGEATAEIGGKTTHKREVTAMEVQGQHTAEAEAIRQRQIEAIVQAKRAEHAAAFEGRVSAEVAAERARQIAEGKVLPQEEVDKYSLKSDPQEADIAVINDDAKNIEQEIINRALTPEEQAAIKAELAELQAKTYGDESKAVQAALPCLTKE